MITTKNLVHHEFIGLKVKVVKLFNKPHNLIGIIIDETKNTIKIDSKIGENKFEEKIIPKRDAVFQIEIPDGKIVEIDGKILSIRPEDRIKKRFKKI